MTEELNLLEWELWDRGFFDKYTSFIERSVELGKELAFSNVRYMIALANSFNQNKAGEEYMYIGGMGVLGNLASYLSEESILQWRDAHDLDVVVKSKEYKSVLDNFFDAVAKREKSNSISDKYTYEGVSFDIQNDYLKDGVKIDAYIPNNPRKGVLINRSYINGKHWENKKKVNLFGISVNVADPLTLLSMKLDVNCHTSCMANRKSKAVRRQKDNRELKDSFDIVNLLGVIQRDGYSPEHLYKSLSQIQFEKFRAGVNGQFNGESYFNGCLIKPTKDYIDEFLSLEEK